MTLSSLFNSLDHLDSDSDDGDDLSPLCAVTASADEKHGQHLLKRTANGRASPKSKRLKITQAVCALPTHQPRFSGTGAPHSETAVSIPTHHPLDNELALAASRFAFSCSTNRHSRPARLSQQSSTRDAEPLSSEIDSPSPSDSCSSYGSNLPSVRVASGEEIQTAMTVRVDQTKDEIVPQNLTNILPETLDGSVSNMDPDTALVPTRSKSQPPSAPTTKLVSLLGVRPPATTARAKSKQDSSSTITSNLFQHGSMASGSRDNHVADNSSADHSTSTPAFGEQITLVSRKSRHPARSGGNNSIKSIKDQCTTISEFASYLQTQSRDAKSKGPRHNIFQDMIVHYAANDPGKKMLHSTKRRMEILSERGAKVVGIFDCSVTHIVSDLAEKLLLLALALQSVNSIPPSIWVIGWAWVTKSINSGRRLEETPYERFHKRLVQVHRPLLVDKDRHRSMSVGTSEYTETGSRAPSREGSEAEDDEGPWLTPMLGGGGLSITTGSAIHAQVIPDPLESVIALAHNMTHVDDSSERSNSPKVPDVTEPVQQKVRAKTTPGAQSKSSSRPHGNGFACLSRNITPTGPRVNQALIDELTRLRDIYEAKKHEDTSNQFRLMNYNRAIRSISNHPTKITSVDQAAHFTGVGTGILEKIGEFIATGRLAKIAAQTTEDLAVTGLFRGIYGVGPQIAHNWYVRGLRTLADVRNRMDGIVLSRAQELGLKYYPDLRRRMPRGEAGDIFESIKIAALELDSKLDIEIMGSFRRGKSTCGDIDILITRTTADGGSHRGLLQKLLPLLHARNLVTHDLTSPHDENELEAKYMGLCQLHNDTLMRRIDILTVPWEQWGASLLYFTGDDLFNRSMRLLARKKGMSLNQRGLFEGVIRDPKTQKKHNEGILVASRTEREIFERLGVPWREPHERVISA